MSAARPIQPRLGRPCERGQRASVTRRLDMAWATERPPVGKVEAQFRMGSPRLDMVGHDAHFPRGPCPALLAGPVVAALDRHRPLARAATEASVRQGCPVTPRGMLGATRTTTRLRAKPRSVTTTTTLRGDERLGASLARTSTVRSLRDVEAGAGAEATTLPLRAVLHLTTDERGGAYLARSHAPVLTYAMVFSSPP